MAGGTTATTLPQQHRMNDRNDKILAVRILSTELTTTVGRIKLTLTDSSEI